MAEEKEDTNLEDRFSQYVDLKRQQADLRDKEKEFKSFFTLLAAERLEDGLGDIEAMDDHGIRFKTKKSSVSVTKLKAAGVDPELIAECTNSYTAMEIY